MAGEAGKNVWLEARDLLRRWEVLTGEIETLMAGDEPEPILTLLRERQELCVRLDDLKNEHGIACWVAGPAAEGLPSGMAGMADMAAVQEEIKGVLKRLESVDKGIRQRAQAKMACLGEKIDQVKRARAASRAYHRRRPSIAGAFIDTRR